MNLRQSLEKADKRYNAKLCLLGAPFKNPGYHSTVASGTWVHHTRQSFEYALNLLTEGSPANVQRACDILRALTALQNRDLTSATYGIWSWVYEEPLAKMNPPDWNWADFCGLNLAEIYLLHKRKLAADVRARVLESLGHAAGSIFRRNMVPEYTNISVMGAIVTSLAGQILGNKLWKVYGRRRLEQCIEHFRFHGGYNEYNSPTYTWVVARDCERGLRLLTGAQPRRLVKFLWYAAWQTLAEHFHAPTGQLAGPQSRSYSTFLSSNFVRWLAVRSKVPLQPYVLKTALHHDDSNDEAPFSLPCPPDLRSCFNQVPAKPYEIKRRSIRRSTKNSSTWGTTWFSSTACLGSVNRDFSWDQRRAVLAYWVGATGKPICLRLRFLHDDREFASCYMFNHQIGPRALSGIHLLLDRGDFHPFWGAPGNNVFLAHDFRVRYEFQGEGLEIKRLLDGRFVVGSGTCRAFITPGDSTFGRIKTTWRASQGENVVCVDAVLYQGKEKAIDFKTLFPVRIAAGLEICDSTSEPRPEPLKWQRHAKGITASWAGEPSLKVTIPERAIPYTY